MQDTRRISWLNWQYFIRVQGLGSLAFTANLSGRCPKARWMIGPGLYSASLPVKGDSIIQTVKHTDCCFQIHELSPFNTACDCTLQCDSFAIMGKKL